MKVTYISSNYLDRKKKVSFQGTNNFSRVRNRLYKKNRHNYNSFSNQNNIWLQLSKSVTIVSILQVFLFLVITAGLLLIVQNASASTLGDSNPSPKNNVKLLTNFNQEDHILNENEQQNKVKILEIAKKKPANSNNSTANLQKNTLPKQD